MRCRQCRKMSLKLTLAVQKCLARKILYAVFVGGISRKQSMVDCMSDPEIRPESFFLVEYLGSKNCLTLLKTHTAVHLTVALPVTQHKQTSNHSFNIQIVYIQPSAHVLSHTHTHSAEVVNMKTRRSI